MEWQKVEKEVITSGVTTLTYLISLAITAFSYYPVSP